MGPKPLCLCSILYVVLCLTGCGNQTPLLTGRVSPTANVQVALYSVSVRAPGSVSVQFGQDTN